MPGVLFLLFLLVPLLELWVILQVGGAIGGGWTVLLLLADSIAGAVIVRREGRRAWTAFRQALEDGRWPADEVAQGALVLIGGALLLTPGFVTDGVGLAFVLPPTRALLARVLRARMRGRVTVLGTTGASPHRPGDPGPHRAGDPAPPPGVDGTGGNGQVLDVEVVSIERDDED